MCSVNEVRHCQVTIVDNIVEVASGLSNITCDTAKVALEANCKVLTNVDIAIASSYIHTILGITHNTTNVNSVICLCTVLDSNLTLVCQVSPSNRCCRVRCTNDTTNSQTTTISSADIDITIVNQVITSLIRLPTENTTNIYAVVTCICHCIVTCSSQIYIDLSLVSTVVNSKYGLVANDTTNTEAIESRLLIVDSSILNGDNTLLVINAVIQSVLNPSRNTTYTEVCIIGVTTKLSTTLNCDRSAICQI